MPRRSPNRHLSEDLFLGEVSVEHPETDGRLKREIWLGYFRPGRSWTERYERFYASTDGGKTPGVVEHHGRVPPSVTWVKSGDTRRKSQDVPAGWSYVLRSRGLRADEIVQALADKWDAAIIRAQEKAPPRNERQRGKESQ